MPNPTNNLREEIKNIVKNNITSEGDLLIVNTTDQIMILLRQRIQECVGYRIDEKEFSQNFVAGYNTKRSEIFNKLKEIGLY